MAGWRRWRRSAAITWPSDRGDRVALARLVNDLEQLPNSEANSGGTFSPRLEAELINMLSRPAIHRDTTNPVEKAQLAAVFGLVGVVLGMLIVAAGRSGSTRSTAASRNKPNRSRPVAHGRAIGRQPAPGGRHRLGESRRRKAGRVSTSLYDKAFKAREEAERQLGIERTINETLAGRTKELETARRQTGRRTRDRQARNVARAEKDAKDAPKLREQIARLEEANQQQAGKARQAEAAIPRQSDGKKALATQDELVRTQYAGYRRLGLQRRLCARASSRLTFTSSHSPTIPSSAKPGDDRPTHRIE